MSPFTIAQIFSALNEHEQAFQWLEMLQGIYINGIWKMTHTKFGKLARESSPVSPSQMTVLYDLRNNTRLPILSHGNRVFSVAFDPSRTNIVTGDLDGLVRVGPISGETPHLLIGHQNHVADVVIDPSGKWIASTEFNKAVVRLWPMPQGKPLDTLPYGELLNRLRTLTNARVVADKNSNNRYQLEFAPFQGWQQARN